MLKRTVWLQLFRIHQRPILKLQALLERVKRVQVTIKIRILSQKAILSFNQSSMKCLVLSETTLSYLKTIQASLRIYGFSYLTIYS